MQKRKLVLYLAMSLDGYIAGPGDDLSWLSAVMVEGEDYGYAEFIANVDTIIVGRKTYDKVLSMVDEFPHANKECFIITRTERPAKGNLQLYTGDVVKLVNDLKEKKGKNIFCDGGAQVINLLIKNQLIDEYIVSIIPIILGDGIRLFDAGLPQTNLDLVESTKYKTGLVKLHYKSVSQA